MAPLTSYSTMAPDSMPPSDRAGLLVILSVLEVPVSVSRLTIGAAAVVSKVKGDRGGGLAWVPRHVQLAHHDGDGAVRRRVAGRPRRDAVDRVLDTAPGSRPPIDRAALLVSRSVLDAPVSVSRLAVGAAGAVVSKVKVNAVEAGPGFPAASR